MLERTWKLLSLRCWVFQKWLFGAGSLEEHWRVELQLWWEWPGYILSWLQNLAVASIQCSFCLQEHQCNRKTHRGLHQGLRKLHIRVVSIAETPYQATPWSCEGQVYIWIETSGCLRFQNGGMSNTERCRRWSQSERLHMQQNWGGRAVDEVSTGSRCWICWCRGWWFLCLGSDLILVGAFLDALNVRGTIPRANVLDWIKGK